MLDTTMKTVNSEEPIRIVIIGGTSRAGSSTEKALRLVARTAEAQGAHVTLFTGEALNLPHFAPERQERTETAAAMIAALRAADGVFLGSPGYHGGLSGLVKNALDYTEDMSKDDRPYFDGRAVGCLATGSGWQGANATLSSLRQITHALRGWPCPLGVAMNTREPVFNAQGECLVPEVRSQLEAMTHQVLGFARAFQNSERA